MIDRNIGFITAEQQERLRRAKVSVLGLGGLGGTILEVLVRTGIGRFSIADNDTFEPTNLNRQVFAYQHTLGRRKIDVAAEWARAINPEAQVEAFARVEEDNVGEVLAGVEVAVMAIDSIGPCIDTSRKCRQLGIPLVEGWAIPYGNTRVFTKETASLEEVYGLPTQGKRVADFTADDMAAFKSAFEMLGQIDGVKKFYGPLAEDRIRRKQVVSFAPTVWLTAVLMALETVKVLLNWGDISLAPKISLYVPFAHRIP